ncbi:ankyrin-1-like [Saccostrea echinata]|uniref:ankyrin-1-like n=1 Tax=Saccostrea echinata TaxID=191078 RepID=UPI002A82B64A|nr:ankyrin-1-like [Saccostrea echinata]
MDVQIGRDVPINELMSQDSPEDIKDVVCQLISQGAINSRDHMGSTPLHIATKCGNVEMVEKLLESGASVFEEDLRGFLPLHVASTQGHTKIVQLLLNKGCNIDKSSAAKFSPLHCASQNGKSDVVSLLLQRGASLDPQNSYGQTPLMLAVSEGHEEVVSLLVDAGSDLNMRDKSTLSVFHHAVNKSSPKCLQILLTKVEKGKMLDHTNIHGLSPFQLALTKFINQPESHSEMLEKLKMFIKAGASPRLLDRPRTFHMMKSPSVFEKLVVSGNVDVVSLILQTNIRQNIHKEVDRVFSSLKDGNIQSASKDMAGLLLNYLSNVASLQHLCRMAIIGNIEPGYQSICQLPLPQNLKNYLQFSDLD